MPKSFLRLSTPPMLPAVAVFPAPEKWESWRSCQPPKIRYCACCCCWLCKARISGALRSYIQMCGTRVVVTQSALTHNRCTRTTVCVAELRGRFSSALVLVTLVVGGVRTATEEEVWLEEAATEDGLVCWRAATTKKR